MMQKVQDTQAESEFFDKFGQGSIEYDALSEASYRKLLRCVDECVAPRPNELLVDFGCGSGAFTVRLHQAYPGSRLMGIDISENCILRAEELLPQAKFMVGDITNSTLETDSVDVLFLFGVLHHFPDCQPLVKEIYRILKPGGRFFSYDPHHYNPPLWLYRARESPLFSQEGRTTNERLIKNGELRDMFAREGFAVKTRIMSGIVPDYAENNFVKNVILPINKVFDACLSVTQLGRVIGPAIIGWGNKPVGA